MGTVDGAAERRTVYLRVYAEPLDLLGKDLISMLSRGKDNVSVLVGAMAAKSDMKTQDMPLKRVTSMAGEVADEIHEWPNATLGTDFRHLVLRFRDGQLIDVQWSFDKSSMMPTKPWWKFW